MLKPCAHRSSAPPHSPPFRTSKGFTMDPPVIAVMFKRHDPDNTSSLSLDEYIRM